MRRFVETRNAIVIDVLLEAIEGRRCDLKAHRTGNECLRVMIDVNILNDVSSLHQSCTSRSCTFIS